MVVCKPASVGVTRPFYGMSETGGGGQAQAAEPLGRHASGAPGTGHGFDEIPMTGSARSFWGVLRGRDDPTRSVLLHHPETP